jgi:hypothetical protein
VCRIDRDQSGRYALPSAWLAPWIALAIAAAELGCTSSKTAGPPSETGPQDTGDGGPIDSGEAGSNDAIMDTAADSSLDGIVDATSPDDASEGGGVLDRSVAPDATSDSSDGAPPDSDPCREAGGPRPVRNEPPLGFVMPPGGAQIDCTSSKPCPPGLMCMGAACDDIWQCYAHADGKHPCPTDYEPYCGCDGVTFMAIRSCPDRPYERVGACEDGVSCDPTRLKCIEPEPPCPDGKVPWVVAGRYGACVPYYYCQCEFVWECPHREKYRCDTTTRRCTDLPPDL